MQEAKSQSPRFAVLRDAEQPREESDPTGSGPLVTLGDGGAAKQGKRCKPYQLCCRLLPQNAIRNGRPGCRMPARVGEDSGAESRIYVQEAVVARVVAHAGSLVSF
jgi:hypothetical protein